MFTNNIVIPELDNFYIEVLKLFPEEYKDFRYDIMSNEMYDFLNANIDKRSISWRKYQNDFLAYLKNHQNQILQTWSKTLEEQKDWVEKNF